LAITIHNFPEGLAVGVGFGAIGVSPSASFESARSLAIGIGLQNFPEGFSYIIIDVGTALSNHIISFGDVIGLAVSLPLMRLGYSPFKAFW
jgi:zinc transporter 11